MMNWRTPLFCLFFLMVTNLTSGSETPRLNLEHKHARSELSAEERLREDLRSDEIRMMRMKTWKTDSNGSGLLPLSSAADFATGQYFAILKVGSPAQRVVLIADTGSDLTWINCKYHRHSVNGYIARKPKRPRTGLESPRRRRRKMFRAYASSSFNTVLCTSDFCKVQLGNLFSLAFCPNHVTPCTFNYRYADGSGALGLFANETVTLDLTNGTKKRLHNVVVGCTRLTRGSSFNVADGVLGLGFSRYSFSRRAAFRLGGGTFSYCLMDHLSSQNVSNYLTFGRATSAAILTPMRFTELLLNVLPPFYAVKVKGIYVGNKLLNIPENVWTFENGGGTILDSGSSLTFLTELAYKAVVDALEPSLKALEKVDPGIPQLDHCFNSTQFDEKRAPRLAIGFSDGAMYEPEVNSYLIDAADGVKCIGIVSASWPGNSVIGNIMQQNHFWEFDLKRNKVGFASSHCT